MPQPNTTVIHQGGFDPGARFGPGGTSLPVNCFKTILNLSRLVRS